MRLSRRHDLAVDEDSTRIAAALTIFEFPRNVMAFPGELCPSAILGRVLFDPVAFMGDELAQAALRAERPCLGLPKIDIQAFF